VLIVTIKGGLGEERTMTPFSVDKERSLPHKSVNWSAAKDR